MRFAPAMLLRFAAVLTLACLPASFARAAGPDLPMKQRIELHRNGAKGDDVQVTLGIPFPPGLLKSAKDIRILDRSGAEVAARVDPTLTWFLKDRSDGGIRAVRVQFHAALMKDSATYYFAIGIPRTLDAPGWPYDEGLVGAEEGVRVPGVLATLSPEWLCDSQIAGPQHAAVPPTAYDNYVATQFEWAKPLPKKPAAWLFDRPTTLYKAYVRTGRFDYLQAAVLSYRFYMSHIKRSGEPSFPACGGGWTYTDSPCDVKYVYIEPILLALGLTGDDTQHDAALVHLMVKLWDSGGWSGISGPYTKVDQVYTERNTGLGLISIVSAYELTGDKRYLEDIDTRVGWLHKHQASDPELVKQQIKNPDGLPPDGSWRHSWQKHEGDDYDPRTDVRGASPWMSENIVDGLWHAWLATHDARIPGMLTAFGRYLERWGWIDPKIIAGPGHDWRHECSGPDGQIAWYWSSSVAPVKALIDIENSDGWYSDEHDVELALPVALARYFETDPAAAKALDRRLKLLEHSYATSCAQSSATPRRFNWNNRGAGVVQWLIRNFPEPAASGARAKSQ